MRVESTCVGSRSFYNRLSRGTFLKYGAQIAGALDKADELDITHRDLKPSNVMPGDVRRISARRRARLRAKNGDDSAGLRVGGIMKVGGGAVEIARNDLDV